MNFKLAQRLNNMAAKDLTMRSKVEKGGGWNYSIDVKNTARLKKIIAVYGWPTIDLVGKEASRSAWLLVQHADEDLDFQKQTLKLINRAYETKPNSIDPANIAYLTDRILVAENKEQEFGTQFYINDDDKLVLRPLRDPNTVNGRRVKYNLHPIEKDLKEASAYVHINKKTNS